LSLCGVVTNIIADFYGLFTFTQLYGLYLIIFGYYFLFINIEKIKHILCNNVNDDMIELQTKKSHS